MQGFRGDGDVILDSVYMEFMDENNILDQIHIQEENMLVFS